MDQVSFNSHHSAFGTYSSFVLGRAGKGGGFILNDVRSPENSVYIGYIREKQELMLLPFVVDKKFDRNAVFGLSRDEEAKADNPLIKFFSEKDITRDLRWATDLWKAGDIEFKLITPFGEVPDPMDKKNNSNLKLSLIPAIFAQLTLDNSNSDTNAKIVFGMNGMGRLVSDEVPKMLGGALDRRMAFACQREEGIEESIGWNLTDQIAAEKTEKNRLGDEVILTMEVPAHTKRTFTFTLAVFQDGLITSGIDSRYAYTLHYKNIEDVLDFALSNKDYYLKLAAKRDNELLDSRLNEHRRFLVSQATRSYLANTQLMIDGSSCPLWIVNEGEYRMINTLDLTIDHIFWEMKYHPWTVKNTLELFADRYSYYEKNRDVNGGVYPGGISFTHDMGQANMFSRPGSSAYERENTAGCFSFMTYEELLNWILTSAVYIYKSGDFEWMAKYRKTFSECFESIAARDLNNDGIMDSDSIRCGKGYEITTYDSLDESLGQARNNLYIAVKTWAALVCLENCFAKLKMAEYWQKAQDRAILIAESLHSRFDEAESYIPAVFENNNNSRIIPAIEGLVYPYIINDYNAVSMEGRYGKLLKTLKSHLGGVLKPGICIDSVSGGWKLSSTSRNTWMSKIFLNQFISENILQIHMDLESEKWDEVHAKWQAGCGEACAVDQVDSEDGKDLGSRLYPRLVTSILWMENKF